MNCPNCGFDVPVGMRYCGMCGTQVSQTCPNCNAANPITYRFCGACGVRLAIEPAAIAEAPPVSLAAIPLDGERRVVTVVVTDVVDSTALLEKVGTEAWVELMNRLLHIQESEVYRYGGEVDQFRGDGLVAFFGATTAHEDDPERAVQAALTMQQAVNRYADELSSGRPLSLQIRVGVNTGEVIVTNVGDRRRHSEETAMGLAVAIAARLCAAAEPGAILASQPTYRSVERDFEWQALGAIPVKGLSQPLAVYRPLSPVAAADRLAPHAEAFPYVLPLIGREAEFEELKRCVEEVLAGRGRLLMLTGETGMGKAFLVNEARQYFLRRDALLAELPGGAPAAQSASAAPAPPFLWLRGRCRSYDQTTPYALWVDLMHDWLGTRPTTSKDETRRQLRRQSEALWGGSYGEHYPYLAALLGLPQEAAFEEKIRHLDGESLRQRLYLAVWSWVEALARRGPLVLTLGNMHWADESSLNLLKHCLPLCDTEAVLCLFVFQPDRASPMWEFRHYVETNYPHRLTHVSLPPLSEAHSRELVGSLIGAETLPEETLNLIVRNAQGNPNYILELIHSLVAQGVLIRESGDGPWRMTRSVTTLDLPGSLQRLLQARIDRLLPNERLALQMASVIGAVFWLNVLEALVDPPRAPAEPASTPRGLKAGLAALQRAQLIQESGRVPELEMQYQFQSALVRDAAYESLLSSQRAALHLKVAEYFENHISPEALVDYHSLLAWHYRCADRPRKELLYTLLAAQQARQLYANAEAVRHYIRALELLDRMEAGPYLGQTIRALQAQRFEILSGRRDVYYQLGQLEAARADARALLPLARQMDDDPAWLIDALLAQPELVERESRAQLDEGRRMAYEALELARRTNDKRRELASLVALAFICRALRDSEGLGLAEQALALARELGDLQTEVKILIGLAYTHGLDNVPRSQEYLEAALSKSEALNDKATEIMLLNALGVQFERRGDYYRQLTEYEQKRLRISREIGNRLVEASAMMMCGQIQGIYLGDYAGGRALEQAALEIWEDFSDRLFILLRQAQIQTAQGNFAEAQATLELARPLSEQGVHEMGRAGFSLVTAILYGAMGGEPLLHEALKLTTNIRQMVAENLISRQYHMAAACEAAAAHLGLMGHSAGEAERQRHAGEALQASQVALNLYRDFGFAQLVECTSEEILFRHSLALAANGQAAEAADYLQRAHDEMRRKHALIPAGSPFHKTYLENIAVHHEIQATYEAQSNAKEKAT